MHYAKLYPLSTQFHCLFMNTHFAGSLLQLGESFQGVLPGRILLPLCLLTCFWCPLHFPAKTRKIEDKLKMTLFAKQKDAKDLRLQGCMPLNCLNASGKDLQ